MSKDKINLQGTTVTTIENVKNGENFILKGGKSVLVRGNFIRDEGINKYESHYFDDVSRFVYKKKGTLVIIGFTF